MHLKLLYNLVFNLIWNLKRFQTSVIWHPHLPNGIILAVAVDHIDIIWPYSGWLALRLTVLETGADFDGIIEVRFTS